MGAVITVNTNGQALTVQSSVSYWTTEALALAASAANDVENTTVTSIGANYSLWFANTATTALITVKSVDGTTLISQTFDVSPGTGPRTLNPMPDAAQAASDSVDLSLLLEPSGCLATSVPRNTYLANGAHIATGRLSLVAIPIRAGTLCTSLTFVSATQAAVNPTAWWFALYDKDLALLRQTADQTTTAWAANTSKTVALATTYTATYTGLYYAGICQVADTVVSLYCNAANANTNTLAPKIGGTSTSSLTTTAPSTAAAISATSLSPYAYIS